MPRAINSTAALPTAYNSRPPLTVDACNSVTGWSTAGSLGSFTFEAIPNPPSENSAQLSILKGASCLRLAQATASQPINVAKIFGSVQNLSQARYIDLLVYYPRPPAGGGQNFTLYIDSTGANFSNWWLATCGGSLTGTQKRFFTTYRIPLSAFTVGGGSPTWATITGIQIRFQPSAADEFLLCGVFAGFTSRAKVLLTLDDGEISQLAAVNEANAAGLPVTLSICPQLSINGAGVSYLSAAQLRTLLAAGNSIQTHGWDHTAFTAYADGGLADFQRQRQWMQDNGLGPAQNPGFFHHTWTNGETNAATYAAARQVGVISARMVRGTPYQAGPPERYEQTSSYDLQHPSLGCWDQYSLNSPLLQNSTYTAATALSEVDKAIRYGATVIFYAHVIGPAAQDFSASEWTTLVNGLRNRVRLGLIDVVTQPQWFDGITRSRALV